MDALGPGSVLSFRPLLVEAVAQLLAEIGWKQPELAECVAEILTSLSRYKEEGKRLFPVVFLTCNLDALLATVAGSEPLRLGTGPIDPTTVRRALKHCAPLGEGRSWVVFLHVHGASGALDYGVFRAPVSPIEPTALEKLRHIEEAHPTTIGIAQMAEDVLELRATAHCFRYVFLADKSPASPSPMHLARHFIDALTRDVPPSIAPAMRHLYYRVLMDVMQTWHGTLAVVIEKGTALPDVFRDGVELDPPLRITERVQRFVNDPSFALTSALQADINLIRGMLSSDGILVFRTDGSLVAYNVFIRHEGDFTLPFPAIGGARRRTFEYLKRLVGSAIVAVFHRSQDGSASFAS